MKQCLALLSAFNLVFQIASTNIALLDSPKLFGLFARSDTFNTIKIDPLFPQVPNDKHKLISFKVFFEEQCAIKCLRNVHCVKYSYSTEKLCQIGLRDGYERHINFNDDEKQKLTSLLNCDLDSCTKGLYCSADSRTTTTTSGTCLCFPSDSGNDCSAPHDSFQLSNWSEWTKCTASCDQLQGFRQRSKDCLKNNNETVNQMDWLCNTNGLADQYQVESCSSPVCLTYKEWSAWSTCSRICGGYMTRKRECFPGAEASCNRKHLSQVQECGLKECDNLLITLDRDGLISTNRDIIKRGFLKLQNVFTSNFMRVFSHSQNQAEITKIGQVVCQEFGFKKLDKVNAFEQLTLQDQFQNAAEYLDFLQNQSITGIRCNGSEQSLKDCMAVYENKSLFELQVECIYDGYWTHWNSWSECSATCGAGVMTRSRTCTDPPPSVSESGGENGLDCPGSKTAKSELTSCFKAKCDDTLVIF